jgi:uncharacterized protein (DUF58 family)
LKISKAGAFYIVMTLLFGFSAVNTGNNLLFLVVSGLLAFMSITGLAGMYNLKKLTPELLPPAEIIAGSAAMFKLRVMNAKRYLPSFLITVSIPGGKEDMLTVIPGKGVGEGTVTTTFPERGRAGIGEITISSTFPVNFFTRYWTFSQDASLIVFPRLLPGVAVGHGDEKERTGYNALSARGQDGELERIFDYSGSEPLRMIHWKLSARTGDLLVKEFGSQVAEPLIIDLDMLPGSNLEERISKAAWLVKRWAEKRPVGLVLDRHTIPPEAGRRHAMHLLTELALYGKD